MADADINIRINAINNTRRAFADFGMILTGFNSALSIARAGIDLFKKALDFSYEGAKLERLQTASYDMARSIGLDMDDILVATRTASLGMVSDLDIMASANKAMMLGVGSSAEDMAQLMEVAAVRGRVMGLSTQQAFEDLVTGIGRQSRKILDNLGIVLDLNTVYDEYAETLGRTSLSLTDAEKKQAILNAVFEDTSALLEETGGLVLDNAGKWEQLLVAEKNYWDSVKKSTSGFAAWWASLWKGEFESGSMELAYDNLIKKAKELGISIKDIQQETPSFFNPLGVMDLEEAIWRLQERINLASGDFTTAEMSALAYYTSLAEATTVVDGSEQALIDYATALNDLETEYHDAASAIRDDLIGALSDLESAQKSWKESVGGDIVSTFLQLAEDAGLTTEEIISRLQTVDDTFGTQEAYEFELNLKTDDLAKLLLEDPAAFAAQGEELVNFFMPLDESVKESQELVAELQAKLLALERTYIATVQVVTLGAGIALSGGGGGGGSINAPFQMEAEGGPVTMSHPYIVGEQGPELFVPQGSGTIIPNNKLGGGANIYVTINTPVNLADEVWVERKLYPYIKQGLQQAMRGA